MATLTDTPRYSRLAYYELFLLRAFEQDSITGQLDNISVTLDVAQILGFSIPAFVFKSYAKTLVATAATRSPAFFTASYGQSVEQISYLLNLGR